MIAPAATPAECLDIGRKAAVQTLRWRYRERVKRGRGRVNIQPARALLGWADVLVKDGALMMAAAVCYDRDEAAVRAWLSSGDAPAQIALCRAQGLAPVLWVWRKPPGGAATRTWGHRWVAHVEAL